MITHSAPLPSVLTDPSPLDLDLGSAADLIALVCGDLPCAVERVGDTYVVAGAPELIEVLGELFQPAGEPDREHVDVVLLSRADAKELARTMPGQITPDEATNSLIITGASADELELLREMALCLDADWPLVH